jgi:pimeloyl-ACP methyl ester carboxylesterase
MLNVLIRYKQEMHAARELLLVGSQVIQTSSGPIEYGQHGHGPPVLVAHGAGGGYDQGLVLGKAFVGFGYFLIAPSRFGYLRSPLPANASPVAQADAYATLLDTLNIEQVVIVAVSDGGPSDLQFALRHRERCSSLVMISAKSHTPPPDSVLQILVFNTIFRSDFLFWSITENFQSFLLSMFGMPEEVQDSFTPAQRELAFGFLGSMHPVSLRKAGIYNDREELSELPTEDFPLECIDVPALIIHAKDDSLQPFSHGHYAAGHIPGARLIAPESAGHMLVAQLEEIRLEVVAFLEEHSLAEPEK